MSSTGETSIRKVVLEHLYGEPHAQTIDELVSNIRQSGHLFTRQQIIAPLNQLKKQVDFKSSPHGRVYYRTDVVKSVPPPEQVHYEFPPGSAARIMEYAVKHIGEYITPALFDELIGQGKNGFRSVAWSLIKSGYLVKAGNPGTADEKYLITEKSKEFNFQSSRTRLGKERGTKQEKKNGKTANLPQPANKPEQHALAYSDIEPHQLLQVRIDANDFTETLRVLEKQNVALLNLMDRQKEQLLTDLRHYLKHGIVTAEDIQRCIQIN